MNPLEYAQACAKKKEAAQDVQETQEVQKAQEAQKRKAPAGIVGKRQRDFDAATSFYRDACAQKAEARERCHDSMVRLNKAIQDPTESAASLLALAVDVIADGLGERPLRDAFRAWRKAQEVKQ